MADTELAIESQRLPRENGANGTGNSQCLRMERIASSGSHNYQHLPMEDAIIHERFASCKELNILVVGCYHMGKSTLINSIFFEEGNEYIVKAEEGEMAHCTVHVQKYPLKIKGIQFNIYDSPGFQDGDEDDMVYMRWISRECPKIHLVIYCTKMGDPVRPSEIDAIRNLTLTFKKKIWKNAIIALTFANQVDPVNPSENVEEHFAKVEQQKLADLERAFKQSNINSIFNDIKTHILPVGSARVLHLPGKIEDWRVSFWKGCIEACAEEGKGALLVLARANHHLMATVGAATSTVSGGVAIVVGMGTIVAGAALSATGFLAPLGVPMIVGGVVGTGFGIAAAAGGATNLAAIGKEKEANKKEEKRAEKRIKKRIEERAKKQTVL